MSIIVRQRKSKCYVDEWFLQPSSLSPDTDVAETDTETDSTEEGTCTYDAIEWGKSYSEGDIVCYNGVSYRIMQDTVADANYKPSDEGMLAIYMVYRGSDRYEWLYGEYVEQGWVREYEDIAYECMTATAVANIYPPDVAVSVWRITIY